MIPIKKFIEIIITGSEIDRKLFFLSIFEFWRRLAINLCCYCEKEQTATARAQGSIAEPSAVLKLSLLLF